MASNNRSDGYRVRLTPVEKSRLMQKSDLAGIPLADALRVGGEQYLDSRIAEQTGQSDDPLLAEFQAVALRVQNRLTGS